MDEVHPLVGVIITLQTLQLVGVCYLLKRTIDLGERLAALEMGMRPRKAERDHGPG